MPTVTASVPSSLTDTAPSDLLTVADVEKVSGLVGIKVLPGTSLTTTGGATTFMTADDRTVVSALHSIGVGLDAMKGTFGSRELLSGLGDAAFIGPAKEKSQTPYLVGFAKGDHTVLLKTEVRMVWHGSGMAVETVLSLDQLKALAAIVASRL